MPELTTASNGTSPKTNVATPYSGAFFDGIEEGSLQSARAVVPHLLELLRPDSVIDVGCGRGAWLRVFWENGLGNVQGVDGAYVDPASLLIPRENFLALDLNKPFQLHGRYDLAICLEVGEHLPQAMAKVLVSQLTAVAPLVVFSAAIPGQGGTNHVNERLPSYWRQLFEERGFAMFDPVRPRILTDTRIEWWYRQNITVYASQEAIDRLPALESYRVPSNARGIEWVHIDQIGRSARELFRQLPPALWSAVRRRLVRRQAA